VKESNKRKIVIPTVVEKSTMHVLTEIRSYEGNVERFASLRETKNRNTHPNGVETVG